MESLNRNSIRILVYLSAHHANEWTFFAPYAIHTHSYAHARIHIQPIILTLHYLSMTSFSTLFGITMTGGLVKKKMRMPRKRSLKINPCAGQAIYAIYVWFNINDFE